MEFIPAKTIVNRTKDKNWFGCDYNMNIYKGCCHGCIYCDSRSECYHVDRFDTVRAKENALELIRDELRVKTKSGVIGTGSMSDPYNPFEKEYRLTRGALELMDTHGFGVAMITKSDLITRDIDVLRNIKRHSPVLAKITVTSADDRLCKKIEPNVVPSSKRFEAVRKLSENGIFTGVLLMPVLPFLEDNEENILGIVRQAHQNGARFVYPSFGVTLRQNQRDWFYQKLDEQFPSRHLKEQYIRQYGDTYACGSPRAKELYPLFAAECEHLHLLYKMRDIVSAYKQGYEPAQLSLF